MTHHMVDCYAAADDMRPVESFHLKGLSDSEAIREVRFIVPAETRHDSRCER